MTEQERWKLIRHGWLRYLTQGERRTLLSSSLSVGPLRHEIDAQQPFLPALSLGEPAAMRREWLEKGRAPARRRGWARRG